MPISKDEFQTIDDRDSSMLDLSPDDTRGGYRVLLENADRAFRQRELVDAVDPERKRRSHSRASRTARLVDHRDRFWANADGELAVTSAGLHGGATADDIAGGFADEDVAARMETAVDPIDTDA